MILWIFTIAVVLIVIFLFWRALNKDRIELKDTTLEQKFSVMVNLINQSAYGGEGRTHSLSWRSFNLYRENAQQIFNFNYSTGHLTVTWKFKWYHQEMVYSEDFNYVRNITDAKQAELATRFLEECRVKMESHIERVGQSLGHYKH
jgi:hypothetical protein